jgi:hypothetical protein
LILPEPGADGSINSNALEHVGGAFEPISDNSFISFGDTLGIDFAFEMPHSDPRLLGTTIGFAPGNENVLIS